MQLIIVTKSFANNQSNIEGFEIDASLVLRYTETKGMDMYNEGHIIGEALSIHQTGAVVLYDMIYDEKCGRPTFYYSFKSKKYISSETISQLHFILSDYGFIDWPCILPEASPYEINMRTPAPSVIIKYFLDGHQHVVNANLGAEKKYYPDGFFKIRRFINEIINQLK